MKKISIGIDFSKQTFDAAIILREDETNTLLGHSKFDNDKAGYRSLLKWAKKAAKDAPESADKGAWIFCGENTGECSLGLCDFLYVMGYDVWLESALVIHRKCGIVRGKDDKADSMRIADYALRNYDKGTTPLYKSDSESYGALRSLYAAHDMLTRDKVSKTNQLKSGVLDHSKKARSAVSKALKETLEQLEGVDAEIKRLLSEDEEFKENSEILQSFTGAGPMTAAALILITHNFRILDNPRALGCHMGVVPYGKKSGTSVDTPPRVSRFRDRWAKSVITCCANSAIRFNAAIKAYYSRLVGKGKCQGVAKNNCKNKIIHILLAMIAKRQKFDPEKNAAPKAA